MPREFCVTSNHLRLLQRTNIGWDGGEYGAPAVDCKRPYGNSDVPGDIAKILEWQVDQEDGVSQEQAAKARALHEEMQTVLQILVLHAEKGIGVGLYRQEREYDDSSWKFVGV